MAVPGAQPSQAVVPKSREIRLGIVMYGGVSLAIYIYGAAHELFRAVRGQGIYKLIKALTDSDIVVDVISGTSAGGINGILLSYALCNELQFGSISSLWRLHGDIRQLLRSPYGALADTTSLLNSEGYYQPKLEAAFSQMESGRKVSHNGGEQVILQEGEEPSPFNELDLFITGTDVDGRVSTQFDDAGHPIDVKDHRALFVLKHRKGRKEPFAASATTWKVLAKLARITSCFPAAFAPVMVGREAADREVDELLRQWGALEGKERCFLDGGVLDNKPFTYTTRAIFSRAADREVERKLFYVEPDPESFARPEGASNPNIVQAVLASLIGIPGYESITEDLRLLAEHNSRLQQYNRLVANLQPECAAVPPPDSAANRLNQEPEGTATREVYDRSRLIAISDRVVRGLLKTDFNRLEPRDRAAAADLIRHFDAAVPPTYRQSLFDDFDVYFRQRRLYRAVYLIYDHLYKSKESLLPDRQEAYKTVLQALNRQIKVYEILQTVMESLIDEAPLDWKARNPLDIWLEVQGALWRLLDDTSAAAQLLPTAYTPDTATAATWLPQPQLTNFHNALLVLCQEIIERIKNQRLEAQDASQLNSVLKRLEQNEVQILTTHLPPNDPIRVAYKQFQELDTQLFPIEMMAGLREKDIIETIRISPRDAQKGFSRNGLSDKLAGDALYHFGGFFKRSWRSNDILWGRLDGLCQLVETLLQPDRLRQIGKNQTLCARIRQRLQEDLDPARLFPQAGRTTQDDLRTWLTRLFADDAPTRETALDERSFSHHLEILVEAAQLEVLYEELPHVVTDALEEQAAWNAFKVKDVDPSLVRDGQQNPPRSGASEPGFDASGWYFRSPGGSLDPFVAITAAARLTQEAMQSFVLPGIVPQRPADTALGRFFKHSYRIGTEQLVRDIPTLVLLEILAVLLLVVRNSILGLFGENIARINANPLYKVFVAIPLRLFHSVVVLARRAPRWLRLPLFSILIVCVLLPIVGIIGRGVLLSNLAGWMIFIVIPIIALLVDAVLLVWVGRLVDWRYQRRQAKAAKR